MATPNINELLETISKSGVDRPLAEQTLFRYRDENFNQFVLGLLQHLVDSNQKSETRQLSGILFKNSITSLSGPIFNEKRDQWISLDSNLRNTVKQYLLNTLFDSNEGICRATAMAISAIALIEVPSNLWPELFTTLYVNVSTGNTESVKLSSLITLQFICNDFDVNSNVNIDSIDKASIDNILNSIFSALSPEHSVAINKHAIQTLYDALCLTSKNFENENERNQIINTILMFVQNTDSDICSYAFKCISRVIEYFYDKIDAYIQQIYTATKTALENPVEQVAIEAATVFQTLIEVETNVSETRVEIYKKYIALVLTDIVPALANAMTKQEEDQEGDIQTLANAAAECISLLCTFTKDAMVPILSPFIVNNFTNENWHYKEASVMLFGCLMSGPSDDSISSLVNDGCSILMKNIQYDSNLMVKDSSAWALGSVLQHHISLFDMNNMDALMNVLLNGLNEVPRVAINICQALGNLAAAVSEYGQSELDTNILSKYAFPVIQGLLKTGDRPDWEDCNLQTNCYEAIILIIEACAHDMNDVLSDLASYIIEKCQQSMVNMSDIKLSFAIQPHLLDVLTSITNKVSLTQDKYEICITIIGQLVESSNVAAHSSSMMLLSPVMTGLDGVFELYEERCFNLILNGLSNYQDNHTFNMCCNAIGDFCRSSSSKVTLYAERFIQTLILDLSLSEVALTSKPLIFYALSDIALSLDSAFNTYIETTMNATISVCSLKREDANDEYDEYLSTLRESVYVFWISAFLCLANERQVTRFNAYIQHIFSLTQITVEDENSDENLLLDALSLLHDMCKGFGSQFTASLIQLSWFNPLITKCYTYESRKEEIDTYVQHFQIWCQQ